MELPLALMIKASSINHFETLYSKATNILSVQEKKSISFYVKYMQFFVIFYVLYVLFGGWVGGGVCFNSTILHYSVVKRISRMFFIGKRFKIARKLHIPKSLFHVKQQSNPTLPVLKPFRLNVYTMKILESNNLWKVNNLKALLNILINK